MYPLSRTDDTLDDLCNAKCFSSIILKTGYVQIQVKEGDREKGAFTTPDGLYELEVMPLGLFTAPETFQRVIESALACLNEHTSVVYLDYAVVFARTLDEHLARLESVIEAIRTSDLTLKPERCRLAYEELKNLSNDVNAAGVLPDQVKISALPNFLTLKGWKSAPQFLGLCA